MADLHKYQKEIEQTKSDILNGTFKADALQKMNLLIKVEEKVAGKNDLVSIAIKTGIREQKPGVLEMVRDFAQDNYKLIADLLGESLTNKILNL